MCSFSVCLPAKVSHFTMILFSFYITKLALRGIFVLLPPHVHSTHIKNSVQLLAMIGTNRFFARTWFSKSPTYAVNWCSPCC